MSLYLGFITYRMGHCLLLRAILIAIVASMFHVLHCTSHGVDA